MDQDYTATSSSNSEENIEPRRKRRNKAFLYKDYSVNDVSTQTKRKYDIICSTKSSSSKFGEILCDSEELDANEDGVRVGLCVDNVVNTENNQFNINSIHKLERNADNNITDDLQEDKKSNFNSSSENNQSFSSCTDRSHDDSEHKTTDDDSDNNSMANNTEENFTAFDKIMFNASNLTVRDVILMITAFALRFHISDEALVSLVSIFQLCAGPAFANFNISKYIMSKCFSSQSEHVTYHYYCNSCFSQIIYSVNAIKKVPKYLATCELCNEEINIKHSSENYFITIDLEYQLKILLSNKELLTDLLQNVGLLDNDKPNVSKGSIHKNILQYNKNGQNQVLLTLNCNTDGAPMTKSGKNSFWPFQVCLNELSAEFKSRFILLTGLLMTSKEPKSPLMNLYISKFTNQIQYLFENGIKFSYDGIKYVFKFCTLCFPVDSVCRPILQNRIQFNGYSGCSWCYQVGKYIKEVHGIRFLRDESSILRSHEEHLQHVEQLSQRSTIRGVKGSSSFSELPFIDMVWSFPFEYMHGLILGVVLQLKNLWKNKDCKFSISKKVLIELENQYLNITPPREIHRLPRKGMITGTTKPKASELSSYLLYYSLPLLKNALNEEALEHYMLLVKSTFTLLKSELSESELTQCEIDLITFVCKFQDLYGQGAMTFNVHTLMHCVQSVRKTGPLYASSAFQYESFIFTLKQFITGPNGKDRQIARKHLQSLIFKSNASKYVQNPSEIALSFCHSLFTHKRLTTSYSQIKDVTFCGKATLINSGEDRLLYAYNKCIYKGSVYHTFNNIQGKKNDDSVVKLMSGDYYRIVQILHCNNDQTCKLKLELIKTVSNDPFPGVIHIKEIDHKGSKKTILTTIENVKSKIVFIKVKHASYLCDMPNTIEIQ